MYTLRVVLPLVFLSWYLCFCDCAPPSCSCEENSQENSHENSQENSHENSHKNPHKNLGPQFAYEYENNGKEIAEGAEALGLPHSQTDQLQVVLSALGGGIAYLVGALAQYDGHIPEKRNDTQANKNGKIAAVIGQKIGEQALEALIPGISSEQKKTIAKFNSYTATFIARFFGSLGDVGTKFYSHKHHPEDYIKIIQDYPNLNNDS